MKDSGLRKYSAYLITLSLAFIAFAWFDLKDNSFERIIKWSIGLYMGGNGIEYLAPKIRKTLPEK